VFANGTPIPHMGWLLGLQNPKYIIGSTDAEAHYPPMLTARFVIAKAVLFKSAGRISDGFVTHS
jgi:hypothetical protein